MYWIEFFISAAIIVFAGIRLTVYADKLSDELQLGKVWIGIVLLGVVTSLPEAVTSLVAVISLQADDLAIGNLLGSNTFNPMFIVVMDILYRQGSLTNHVRPDRSHQVAAYFAILLVFLAVMDITFNKAFPSAHWGPLSVGGALIAVFYFIGMRRLAHLGVGATIIASDPQRKTGKNKSIIAIWIQLLISAVLVITGAIWLAESADTIALETGLGRTFVGSIFLAFVTSLPELVVTLSALRLGSLDLAIGNIFGSNMTNMFIVFLCGAVHRGGPILGAVSITHIATGVLSILLTYVAIKGILIKDKKTILGVGWDSVVMIILFFVGTSFLYQLRSL